MDMESSIAERLLASAAVDAQSCLSRGEVQAYLGRRCPQSVRARVEAHTPGCVACAQWIRHLDDEILEYMGGQRPEEELARMDAHLDACGACRDLMHHVVQGMALSWQGDDRSGARRWWNRFGSGQTRREKQYSSVHWE